MRLRVVVKLRDLGLYAELHAAQRFAVQAQRQGGERHVFAGGDPVFRLYAGHHRRRPDRADLAQCLHFAIGVGVTRFDHQLAGAGAGGQAVDHGAPLALGAELQRQLVGHDLGPVAVVVALGFFAVAVFIAR